MYVRSSATRAVAELLSNPLSDKEESILFHYLDNVFKKGSSAMQDAGRYGLVNLVKANSDKADKFARLYLLKCYAERSISIGYFQALAEMLIQA